ncbi:MAG: S8 family serine peptidase [Pseudomarimonas sp.]
MNSRNSNKAAKFGRMAPLSASLAVTFFSGLAVSPAASTHPTLDMVRAAEPAVSPNTLLPMTVGDSAYYTVVLREDPVASYRGGLPGLPMPARRTPGATSGKLDMQSPATRAYATYLENRQFAFLSDINSKFGRQVDVMARMQHALNAVIVGLTSDEAAALALRDDVLIVEREQEQHLHTDVGPTFIGAPSIWNGLIASGAATRGEGIVVGIIDSGINWESPSFAAVGPVNGYTHVNPNGSGTFLGNCAPGGVDAGRCNNKLIGIYNFAAAATTGTDTDGHGSHTASTVAGNLRNGVFGGGNFQISGVAPHANVISYLACPTSCPTTATTQSVNQAVIDGVDVINFSISGGTSPWTDTTSVAFRNANAAGVFIAASAGNTRAETPDPQGNVNHLEPWVETVAASSHNRLIAVSFDLTGQVNPPANTQDRPIKPGAAPLPTANLVNVPLIKSPGFSNGSTDGCTAYPSNTFTRLVGAPGSIFNDGFEIDPVGTRVGAVAVLNLDGTASNCGSGVRRAAALAAGAVGVIFVDVIYLNLGASGTSWSMLRSDWNNVEAAANPATATVSIDVASTAFPAQGDVVAGFSLRGPRLIGGQGLVKPDITGPGVDILAVGAAANVGANGIYLNSGTSMSGPHLAGSAALIRALQPTWTPPEVKSALNLSSNNFGSVNQDGTPVRPWDYGSGRVNLEATANVGLVMDETPANFLAANPATGGDISTLNLASMAKFNAIGATTFTRTFRRVRTGTQTYNLTDAGYPVGAVQISPASFTLAQNATQVVTVTVQPGLLTPNQWTLGEVLLAPAGGNEPNLHLPMVVFPGGPTIAVSPTSISASSSSSVSNNLTISNTGNPTLSWQVQPTGTATIVPFNTTSTTNGQLGGTYLNGPQCTGATCNFHWSQNFDLTGSMRITTLRANGFTLPGTTALSAANTPSITFSVYADNAGEPAGAPPGVGAPSGLGAAPIWTFTGAINAANGITTTGGALSLDLLAANVAGTPLNLSPGRYWMTVTPTTTSTAAQTAANPLWAWFVSGDTQVGNLPRLFAPHVNPAALQPAPTTFSMFSGFVQGTVNCELPTWVQLTTTSGTLGFAGSQTIPVQFNAGSLALGTYTGNLCISSNATNAAVVPVPLSFTVTAPTAVAPTLSKAFAPTSITTGQTSTLTIALGNGDTSVSTLSANLVDTFPAGVVVAPTPNASTTCGGGNVTATAGSGSVSLASGATIPASGSCTVAVDVTSAAAGAYANSIPAGSLQTSTGNNAAAADATLTVTPPVVLSCTTGMAVEVEATAGTAGPTGYTTLKGAFDAINAGTHQGVLDISVCGDTTETATAVLNASGEGPTYTAATITPAGGAARSISGESAAGTPLIDFNGADNVTIDGLNSGGNALTISNTSTSNTSITSTIRFIGGASGNTITNSNILGSATVTTASNGGTIFFSSAGTSTDGNDNNTISNNNIGPAGSNLPTKGIHGNGSQTAPATNSGIIIQNNNIFDFFSPTTSSSGVNVLSGNDNWTISGNRIYQTAPRTFTAAGQRYAGITLNTSAGTLGAFTLTNNRIGFGSSSGTGTTSISGATNSFRGIDIANVSLTVPSSVQGNVVSGIEQSTASTSTGTSAPFIGIMLGSSNGLIVAGDVVGNRVGSLDASSGISYTSSAGTGVLVGIYNFSNLPANVSNSEIGSVTIQGTGTNGFRGILTNTNAVQLSTINANTIANISNSQVGNYSIAGIQTISASVSMSGNTIRNLTGNANGAAVVMQGISVGAGTATQPSVISRNTIHSLRNTVTGGAAGAIYAIDVTLGTHPNVIERNSVHSITVDSTFLTYQIWGMILRGNAPSTATVKNNMIRLGFDAAGASITNPYSIIGIRDIAGTNVANNFFHNSVYIGGSGVVTGGTNSFAFNSNTVTTTRSVQNNIFWNARSNAVGGGSAHFALTVAGTAANPPGQISDFNDLLVSGTDGAIGLFNLLPVATLTDWRTATGLDLNSRSADPQFIAPNGNAATGDLHISAANPTPIEAAGTLIASVTDDFDGQDRTGLSPTDIGADAGNFVPVP